MLNDHPLVKKRLAKVEERRAKIVPFVNLGDVDANLPFDIPYFMNSQERELCRGNDTIHQAHPPMHIMHYQCHYLTRNDPFLRLGPFKYEPLNDQPHIALLRDFASIKQVETVRQQVCLKITQKVSLQYIFRWKSQIFKSIFFFKDSFFSKAHISPHIFSKINFYVYVSKLKNISPNSLLFPKATFSQDLHYFQNSHL